MKTVPVSPDGRFYLAAGRGELVPKPYSLRWLMPWLLKGKTGRWVAASVLGFVMLPLAGALYFAQVAEHWAWATALLLCLPIFRTAWYFPVLTDVPAFVFSLLSAACALHGWIVPSVLLACLAGACRESAPVFAALWAWSPWPLLGVVAAGWWRKSCAPDDRSVQRFMQPLLKHPFKTAWAKRLEIGFEPLAYVFPWGGVVAGLALGGWQVWVTTAVAYGQMIAAQDTVRLYQWAAPVLCAAAVTVVPVDWFPVLFLLTLFHIRTDAI